jgi:protein-disulfide isomerase
VREWRQVAEGGKRYGPDGASVTITEFSDFQCPYCRRFSDVLKQVKEKYPSEVNFSFRHFPLDRIHPHARAAAIAAECSARAGAFERMHDLLFQRQDSLGKLPWQTLAARAGIADTSSFAQCMADESTAALVRTDFDLGRKLGVKGTPTVMVNEWRIVGASFARVDSIVESLLSSSRR